MTAVFFPYPDEALDHLASLDDELAHAVRVIGRVERTMEPDPFRPLMKHIVGQQISTKAQEAVWARVTARVGTVTPEAVAALPEEELRACGMSLKKADWMRAIAVKVASGETDLEALRRAPDAEVVAALTAFAGVGLWTAEMLMIFSYGRPDVLSIGDFGVRHGVRVVYGREMTTKELRELKTRVSPWGSVASIIFWAAASGRFDLRRPDRSESAEG